MSVRIFLDRPHAYFTNLDYITGKAVLALSTETPITSIVVKLEGESRTRLASAKYPHNERSDKKRTEIELHKSFPRQRYWNMPRLMYSIPYRQACTSILFGSGSRLTTIFADFKFLPIEPPRKKEVDKESYARREHQFKTRLPHSPQEKKGLFKGSSENDLPPRFSVDARLPSPPILTCNEPLPLRILIKKLNDSNETVHLQLLQLELISYTHVRAQDLTRTESGSWVIVTRSNIGMPLGNGSERAGKEWKMDAEMWNRIPLPNSVSPSFETCNLSRAYELEIRVGLAYGPVGSKQDLIVLPLRMAVQVFSGIAPPQALLDAMDGQPSKRPIPAPVQGPGFGFGPGPGPGPGPGHLPPSQPMPGPGPGPSPGVINPDIPPPQPPRPGPANHPMLTEDYEEAPPPSYEDAMADALAPVDGPRREYNPLAASQRSSSWTATDPISSVSPGNPRSNSFGPYGPGGYDIDSKSDERLFPSEAGSQSPTFAFTSIPPVTNGHDGRDRWIRAHRHPDAEADTRVSTLPDPWAAGWCIGVPNDVNDRSTFSTIFVGLTTFRKATSTAEENGPAPTESRYTGQKTGPGAEKGQHLDLKSLCLWTTQVILAPGEM
ncbi:arrestin [Microsporum canis CBS 113480]|uniref:Arrestin n=1 Tax=Arthroderma otae (strain ATCC MYA-4605 / CBS 113480) TaxID=554155 RepID=C5FTE4_ARTOC|nr:arrestin [Microsporum canis CBS 113480]EEQ33147.1 arrestin [Microsporum canis CBS 113480]